jgi:hypothetical protein
VGTGVGSGVAVGSTAAPAHPISSQKIVKQINKRFISLSPL